MNKHMSSITSACAIAGLLLFTLSASGADWLASGTANWFAPGNWSTNSVPASGDVFVSNGGTAVIGSGAAGSTYTVIGQGDTQTGGVLLTGNGVWNNTDAFIIGNNDSSRGTLTVSGSGSLQTKISYIGRSANSGGDITVSDNGYWYNSQVIFLGENGAGSLTVSGNGRVTSGDKISIGHSGSGTVALSGSATLRGWGVIGENAGSNGTVTVSENAVWRLGAYTLTVGAYGSGELIISDSGYVNSLTGFLGENQGGSGAVTISDSGWWSAQQIYVGNGDGSTGTLTLGDRARITADTLVIASGSGARGLVTVSGNAVYEMVNLFIAQGMNSSGTMIVEDNAQIEGGGGFAIGYSENSRGTLIVRDNAQLVSPADITVGGGYYNSAGEMLVQNNARIQSSSAFLGSGGSAIGNVTLSDNASWTVTGVFDARSGTLTVKDSAGISSQSAAVEIGYYGTSGVAVLQDNARWNNSLSMAVNGGTLTVRDSAVINSGENFSISSQWVNAGYYVGGAVTVSGSGSIVNGQSFTIGSEGSANYFGTLILKDDAAVRSGLNGHFNAGLVSLSDNALWSVGADFFVGSNATLSFTVNAGRATPYLTVGGSATLSGTLAIANYAALPDNGHWVLLSADSGIVNDFTAFTGAPSYSFIYGGSSAPTVDYLTGATGTHHGLQKNANSYDLYKNMTGDILTWYAGGTSAHGNFTMNGSDYTVNVPLNNVAANSAKNWNGNFLNVSGTGALTVTGLYLTSTARLDTQRAEVHGADVTLSVLAGEIVTSNSSAVRVFDGATFRGENLNLAAASTFSESNYNEDPLRSYISGTSYWIVTPSGSTNRGLGGHSTYGTKHGLYVTGSSVASLANSTISVWSGTAVRYERGMPSELFNNQSSGINISNHSAFTGSNLLIKYDTLDKGAGGIIGNTTLTGFYVGEQSSADVTGLTLSGTHYGITGRMSTGYESYYDNSGGYVTGTYITGFYINDVFTAYMVKVSGSSTLTGRDVNLSAANVSGIGIYSGGTVALSGGEINIIRGVLTGTYNAWADTTGTTSPAFITKVDRPAVLVTGENSFFQGDHLTISVNNNDAVLGANNYGSNGIKLLSDSIDGVTSSGTYRAVLLSSTVTTSGYRSSAIYMDIGVNGSHAVFSGSGLAVNTSGWGAHGVWMGIYSVSTGREGDWYATNPGGPTAPVTGTGANGTGFAYVADSTLTLQGERSAGLAVTGSGNTALAERVTINSNGAFGYGALSVGGAEVVINGGAIVTAADNGLGLYVAAEDEVLGIYTDSGGTVHGTPGAARFSGSGLSVTTQGNWSYALQIGGSSSAALASSTLATTGAVASFGIWAKENATVSGSNLTVTTSGTWATALQIESAALVVVIDSNISADGDYAMGADLTGGGVLAGTRLNISTGGAGGVGVRLLDTGTAFVSGSVTTAGDYAFGVYVPSAGAHGVVANGAGVAVDLAGGIALTTDSGKDAWGASAENGSVINFHRAAVSGNATLLGNSGTFNLADTAGTSQRVTLANGSEANFTGGATDFTIRSLEGDDAALVTVSGGTVSVANDLGVTFSGTLDTRAGVTVLLSENAVSAARAAVAQGAVLQLGGYNQILASLDNNGLVDFVQLGKRLTISGNLGGNGAFRIDTDISAEVADNLLVQGSSAGAHQFIITNLNNAAITGQEAPLLVADTADGVATFSGGVSAGMYDYEVKNGAGLGLDASNWYLALNGSPDPGPGPTPPPAGVIGEEVLATAAIQSLGWFSQLDNIVKRMGELRTGRFAKMPRGSAATQRENDDKTVTAFGDAPRCPLADWLENVWVRSYGGQTDVSGSVVGKGITDYQYGMDLGADWGGQLDADNDLYAGIFFGYSHDDYRVRTGYSNSAELGGYYTGAYATWLHESGLYADFVAKAQHFDHHFEASDMSGNRTTGDYENWGLGASLEIGRKVEFRGGWFIEPQLQAAYVHLTSSGYWTGGSDSFAISIGAADIVQLRAGSLFGRTLRLTGGGFLQPYVKVSGVEQISSGGKLSATNGVWRPNLDGARAELGAGLIWQLDANNQIHFEYEAAFGDKYDRPWGLTAGYRYQF